jgi:hypothetical protein
MQRSFESFAQFWPFYLSQHSRPITRVLHYIGTSVAILYTGKAIVSFNPLWLLAAAFMGYFFAWLSHLFVEKNRPATFTYPLWSLRGDFKMFYLWLTGELAGELEKYDIQPAKKP